MATPSPPAAAKCVRTILNIDHQAQAAYKISYDGTSFMADSLQVNVEWNALGCGDDDLPWFVVNGSLMQYDWYDYCLGWEFNYCQVPSYCDEYGCSYTLDWNCVRNRAMSERLTFSTNLQIGQNSFNIYSNNDMCDDCGCPYGADNYICDGVYAKIKIFSKEEKNISSKQGSLF